MNNSLLLGLVKFIYRANYMSEYVLLKISDVSWWLRFKRRAKLLNWIFYIFTFIPVLLFSTIYIGTGGSLRNLLIKARNNTNIDAARNYADSLLND